MLFGYNQIIVLLIAILTSTNTYFLSLFTLSSKDFIMLTNDYEVHDIYQYTRKTYKQNKVARDRDNDFENSVDNGLVDSGENSRDVGTFELLEDLPRSDDCVFSPGCHHDTEGDLANILHQKCPVIALAQHQLLRLLDERDRCVRAPNAQYSPLISYLCWFTATLWENQSHCVLVALIFMAFFTGLLLGAATCGTHHGKFNSPILNCIDNYFIPDSHISVKDTFRCIT